MGSPRLAVPMPASYAGVPRLPAKMQPNAKGQDRMTTPKIAIVTGAGTGVGRAAALALMKAGYVVALAGRRKDKLDEVAAEGAATQGRSMVVPTDDLPLDKWRAVVDTNLTGPFICTQEAFRIMKAQTPRGGRIINNGSISAHTPRPMSAAYTSTKHAITGLTKQTALDGRPFDICCGQIDIGNAATPLTERMVQGAGVMQPDGRMMQEARMEAEHVGDAVVYMANLPLSTNVLFMTVMANQMPFVGRG